MVRKHALSRTDKRDLWKDFFTVQEIEAYDNLQTPDGEFQHTDINSPLWKAVRKRRVKEAIKLKQKGLTNAQIRIQIGSFLRQKGAPSPTDFLKAEYKEKEKTKDYDKMVKQIKDKINKTFNTSYYRTQQKNPRYKPVRRPLVVKRKR